MSTYSPNDSELAELREIIREDYGLELDIDQVRSIADRLIGLYEVVFSQKGAVHD